MVLERELREEPTPMTREQIATAVASGDPDLICAALVAAALHDPDWEYVEQLCLDH